MFESYIAGVYKTHGFEETKTWLTKVLEPYVKEAIEVVKTEHLLTRTPRGQTPGTAEEEGEVQDFDRERSPSQADVGSIVDPGTLSYFNQWLQQNRKTVEWKTADAKGTKATPLWRVEVWMDGKKQGSGTSTGKKGAKILAAKQAMQNLGVLVGEHRVQLPAPSTVLNLGTFIE